MVISQHVTLTYFSILVGITCGFLLPVFGDSEALSPFRENLSLMTQDFAKLQNVVKKFNEMLLLLLSAVGNVCSEAATVTMDK